jgi:serine O-acetyltransferase
MPHVAAKVVGLGHNDPVFARIRVEAQEAMARDPGLSTFLMTAILNHDTLERAISHRVAERLAHPDLPSALIRQAYDEVIARDSAFGEAFRADLLAVADRDPACLRMMEPLLYFKGFHALQTHRLAHAMLKARPAS